MMISRKEAAEKIGLALEADDRENFEARVWVTQDSEKVRIYVRDLGYTNAQDRGFIAVLESGEIESHLLRNSGYAFDVAREALKGFVVEERKLFQRATKTEVEASLSRQKAHNYSSDEWHFGAADEESF